MTGFPKLTAKEFQNVLDVLDEAHKIPVISVLLSASKADSDLKEFFTSGDVENGDEVFSLLHGDLVKFVTEEALPEATKQSEQIKEEAAIVKAKLILLKSQIVELEQDRSDEVLSQFYARLGNEDSDE